MEVYKKSLCNLAEDQIICQIRSDHDTVYPVSKMFRTVIILVLALVVLSTSMPQSGGTGGQEAAGSNGGQEPAGGNGGQQGPGGFPNLLHGFNQFLNGNGTEGGVLGLPIKIFQGGLNGLQGGINGILGG